MNQILCTKLNSNKKKWFKIQFTTSLVLMFSLLFCGGFYFYTLKKQENFSDSLITNYNIYRLYHNAENTTTSEDNNGLFGIIEIPKINLYYPVFSTLTEELLKISPCKFYGSSPKINGNICIAGHNYDNSLFFSKISTLQANDQIFIFDQTGAKFVYVVYDKYEVKETDLSPILNYEPNEKSLTLVTCNNLNANRIILKAKQQKGHE